MLVIHEVVFLCRQSSIVIELRIFPDFSVLRQSLEQSKRNQGKIWSMRGNRLRRQNSLFSKFIHTTRRDGRKLLSMNALLSRVPRV